MFDEEVEDFYDDLDDVRIAYGRLKQKKPQTTYCEIAFALVFEYSKLKISSLKLCD